MGLCENCKSLDLCTAVKSNKEACFFFSPTEKYRIENSKEYAIGYEQCQEDILHEVRYLKTCGMGKQKCIEQLEKILTK